MSRTPGCSNSNSNNISQTSPGYTYRAAPQNHSGLYTRALSLSLYTHTVTHTRTLNTTAQHTRTRARARAPQREADGTHNRAQSMRAVPWMAPPTDHHEHELIVPLEGRPSPSCLPSVAKATSRSIISCTPGAVGSLWTAQGSGLGSYSPHIPHPHTPHLDRAR